ncbi:MAG TPA: TlyA family RNA methyltransferase [Thermoanaerobacterales bacterium]|nr:TlyA family RNA methyltransferase [Thermoanaerobacterales bacterium]
MKQKKMRLDNLLVKRNFYENKEKAKRAIMAGIIFVNNIVIDKPGTQVDSDSTIKIKDSLCPYVSRGGFKLSKALAYFDINVENQTVVDIGASTGGFTDCLLKNGAKKVYAIDVGYGQLDWKLRNNSRVIPMERRNIRYIKQDDIGEKCDLATIDVSFISLKKVIPPTKELLSDKGQIIALIKPQFEARKHDTIKGVIRSPSLHYKIINSIIEFALKSDLNVKNLTYSPITGPKGNIEFLIHMKKCQSQSSDICKSIVIEDTIKAAHQNFFSN